MNGMRRLTAATSTTALVLASSLAFAAAAPAATSAPASPPPITSAAGGRVQLLLEGVGGSPPFEFVGRRTLIRGIVTPYVGGQTVKISFYRDGRKVSVQIVPVQAIGNGQGKFQVGYASSSAGLLEARVVHYATPWQAQFTGRSPGVRYVQVNLGPGAQGQSVRLLQSELNVLHYAVPLSGVFDEGTGRALIAYRKVTGQERIRYAGRRVFELLAHHAGAFHVRYARDGRHVEGDLTRQVLAEIEPGGRVRAIYTMSSGKPSTPTVIGHFQVYLKTPGVNSEGMVDSNYFIRGYAIHGYPEVPIYAASHGCLRVPIPDAPAIYSWVHEGTAVDVYNEGGGGSNSVRGNAGP